MANALTRCTAHELATRVRHGEFTAREVVQAHIDRMQQVDARLNAVVLRRFDEALHEADAIDQDRAQGKSLGPLAGVPITVKECFHVRGLPSTLGVAHYRGEIAAANGPLVARLRHAGAIVLGKTNVPQLMMLYESMNPVYGRTLHPERDDRSPGGSSGGEAAIIAAEGVPLGLGSDLGGSIRQPAHSCGICGLKPTTGRLTTQGALLNLHGMEAIGVQPGPMARAVADLALAMQALVAPSGDRGDPALPPVAWNDGASLDARSLRIGYFEDDGYFTPAPAIRRAVREAVQALGADGVVVRELMPPDIGEAMRIYFGLIGADGGADFRRMLGDSPGDAQVGDLLRLGRLPNVLRPPLAWWFDRAGQHSAAELVRAIRTASADAYWQLVERRNQYAARFYHALDSAEIDALVCPAFGTPALPHDTSTLLTRAGSYCMLPNLLGTPAGVIPWTRVRADETSDRPASRDREQLAAQNAERESAGLPIGVQVVARPWREDVVLAVMARLEGLRRDSA